MRQAKSTRSNNASLPSWHHAKNSKDSLEKYIIDGLKTLCFLEALAPRILPFTLRQQVLNKANISKA